MNRVSLVTLGILLCLALPFGLDKNKEYKDSPRIEGFKRSFGDVDYGKTYYLGEDIAGFETELQITYGSSGLVNSALLILGPSGIDSYNCIIKYKEILSLLSKKYGSYSYIREKKDPLADEMVSLSVCGPVRVGLHEFEAFWKLSEMAISAKLIGDSDGYYVEINYTFRNEKKPKELEKFL